MNYPQGIKLECSALRMVKAKWEDPEFSYCAWIQWRYDGQWVLAEEAVKKPKSQGKPERRISLLAEANRPIRAALEAVIVPEKLNALERAHAEKMQKQQDNAWRQKKAEQLIVEAAPAMLETLHDTRAYLSRQNHAMTLDELKEKVEATIEKTQP